MAFPQVGEQAPDFSTHTETGAAFRLSELRGKRVVLYFYPEADTPGCTKQSCNFRDNYHLFSNRDVVVLGASPDPVAKQAAFKAKYDLPFILLADADHNVSDLYGLWGTHKLVWDGQEHLTTGTRRSTFMIDENGTVVYAQFGVTAATNTAEILDELDKLGW